MNVLTKFEVLCEKKKPTIIEIITFNRKKIFHIWAPGIINNFRDKINADIFNLISIKPTDDKMEFFGDSQAVLMDEELNKIRIVLKPN